MSGVVSVGVAVGAAAMAATDVAAVGLTLTTAFEVAGAVGAAVGAVGAITKNKGLMIAGAGLGIVGGVGSLAAGAGMFAGAAAGDAATGVTSTAPMAFTEGDATGMMNAANMAPGMPSTAAAGIPGGSVGGGGGLLNQTADPGSIGGLTGPQSGPVQMGPESDVPPQGVVNMLNGAPSDQAISPEGISNTPTVTATGAPTSTQPTNPDGTPMGLGDGGPSGSPAGDQGQFANPTLMGAAPAAPVAPAPATPGQTANAPATGDTSGLQPTAGPYKATVDTNGIGSVKGAPPATSLDNGLMSSLFDFVKKNPTLALGGLSAAGSFLSGAMSPLTPAQVNALNAQATKSNADARLADTQTARLSRQLANTSAAIPKASRTPPVGPTPLINRT